MPHFQAEDDTRADQDRNGHPRAVVVADTSPVTTHVRALRAAEEAEKFSAAAAFREAFEHVKNAQVLWTGRPTASACRAGTPWLVPRHPWPGFFQWCLPVIPRLGPGWR